MSRVGKKTIEAVKGVDIKVAGGQVTVKGPKGELKLILTDEVAVKVENGEVLVQVEGIPTPEAVSQLAKGGLSIQGHRTLPCRVRLLDQEPEVPHAVHDERFVRRG